MNGENIYVGCRNCEMALGEGGHSRRRLEAFAVSLFIKAQFGHSALKLNQREWLCTRLGIGRRRKQRIFQDIIRFNYGRECDNGTIVINKVKTLKEYRAKVKTGDDYNNIRIAREEFTSLDKCVGIKGLIHNIRQIAVINHIHKQGQATYLVKKLHEPKSGKELHNAIRRARASSKGLNESYEHWSMPAILKLIHSGKQNAYRLLDDLEECGMLKTKRFNLEKIGTLPCGLSHTDKDYRDELLSAYKEKGKGVFVIGNVIYKMGCNQYSLLKDADIFTLYSNDSRHHNLPLYLPSVQ